MNSGQCNEKVTNSDSLEVGGDNRSSDESVSVEEKTEVKQN